MQVFIKKMDFKNCFLNIWISKMVNTVWINAVNGRDFHPLADHRTK